MSRIDYADLTQICVWICGAALDLRPDLRTKKPLSRLVKAQFKLAVYINRNLLTNNRVFNIGAASFVILIASVQSVLSVYLRTFIVYLF